MNSNTSIATQNWTPALVVERLAEIVITGGKSSDSEIYEAMSQLGIPDPIGDRAYKFTQIAWGRVFLSGKGITFSPKYFCFNQAGFVMESGLLGKQPFFIAAMNLAEKYCQSKEFALFAITSADVGVVNDALHQNCRIDTLELLPPFLFLESPTPEGMERAQRFIAEKIKSGFGEDTPKSSNFKPDTHKPWWKIWK
jgi:hypothetical protein